jgi:hypothetical protein
MQNLQLKVHGFDNGWHIELVRHTGSCAILALEQASVVSSSNRSGKKQIL